MDPTSPSKLPGGPVKDVPIKSVSRIRPRGDGDLDDTMEYRKNPKDSSPTPRDSVWTGVSTCSPPEKLQADVYDPTFDEPTLPKHHSVRPTECSRSGYGEIETEAQAWVLGGSLDSKRANQPDGLVPKDNFRASEGDGKKQGDGDVSPAHHRHHPQPPASRPPAANVQRFNDGEASHTSPGAGKGSQAKHKRPTQTDYHRKKNPDSPKDHPEFTEVQGGNPSVTNPRPPSRDRKWNSNKWPMYYSVTQLLPSLGMRYPPARLQGVAKQHNKHPVFQRCTCGDIVLIGEEHCTLEACTRRLMTATGLDVYEDAPAAQQISRDFVLGYETGLYLKVSRIWWRINPQEWLRQAEVHKEISRAECEKRHLYVQNLRLKRDQSLELSREGIIPAGKGRGLSSLCLGSMEVAEREVVDDNPPNLAAETWETWEKVHTDIPVYDYDEPFDEEEAYYFYGVDDVWYSSDSE